MRALLAVALMALSVSAMGAAPKASVPASDQAFFKEALALALTGDDFAQWLVGMSYENGLNGQAVNIVEAVKWYRLSAEQGYAAAQFELALMYSNGEGVLQDYKEAAKWYRLSAEQGIAEAQFNLALMYDNGRGVLQDYKEAAKWYRLSAEQGTANAQANLGVMYSKGQGVPQDLVYSHMWANIAASNGSDIAAKNRDVASKNMTPSQLEKAQELARACVKKNYKGC
jgi:uncharacterized protein